MERSSQKQSGEIRCWKIITQWQPQPQLQQITTSKPLFPWDICSPGHLLAELWGSLWSGSSRDRGVGGEKTPHQSEWFYTVIGVDSTHFASFYEPWLYRNVENKGRAPVRHVTVNTNGQSLVWNTLIAVAPCQSSLFARFRTVCALTDVNQAAKSFWDAAANYTQP